MTYAKQLGASLVISALVGLGGCNRSELCGTSSGTSVRLNVASQLAFELPDEHGVSEGFNLDGALEGSPETGSCNREQFVSPEGEPGIDNQFSRLWNLLVSIVGDAVEGLIQGVINDGTLLLMFEVDGIDDYENDPCVNVHIYKGEGRPDLGTDGYIAPSQTYDVQEDTPYTVTRGYIENGVLHAGPFDAVIPIAVFYVVADLRLHGAYLRATFDEDGSMTGVIGGGVETEQIMDIARQAAEDDGNAQALLPALPLVLRTAVDLGFDEEARACTQVSTVMRIQGTPAFLYDDANSPSR